MKELWVYAPTSALSDTALNLIRADYPAMTIRRANNQTEFWLTSPLTEVSQRQAYVSGEVVSFPDSVRTNWLATLSGSDWNIDPLLDGDVDKGVWVASLLGQLGSGWQGGTVHILDFEPAIRLFTKQPDSTYLEADKQALLNGIAELRDLAKATRPDLHLVANYGLFPTLAGRTTTEFAAGSKMIGHAAAGGFTGTDDTPLFGEKTQYVSNRSWVDIIADSVQNLLFAYTELGLQEGDWVVPSLYADNRMLEPDDPRLVGSSGEGVAGGLDLWKTLADSLAASVPAGVNIAGALRRFTSSGALQTADPGELAIEEEYFRGQVAHLAATPAYKAVAVYASTSPVESYIRWAADEIQQWMDAQPGDEYIIVDDDGDGLPDSFVGAVARRWTGRRDWLTQLGPRKTRYRGRRKWYRPNSGDYRRDDF